MSVSRLPLVDKSYFVHSQPVVMLGKAYVFNTTCVITLYSIKRYRHVLHLAVDFACMCIRRSARILVIASFVDARVPSSFRREYALKRCSHVAALNFVHVKMIKSFLLQ